MDRNRGDVLAGLLGASHFAAPDDVPQLVSDYGRGLGATDVTLYLTDYDQRVLVPVPNGEASGKPELPIDGTVAGRSFRALAVHHGETEAGRRTWVPLLDGTERLGVLEMAFPEEAGPFDEAFEDDVKAFAGMVAELIATKAAYGDFFECVRRRKTMSLAAELAWQLLPPLTFGGERVVISGALIPTYDVGGDSFDYGVDRSTARLAVFDAMGHGLEAGLLSTVAVAAYRNARRRLAPLAETVAAIDAAIAGQFGPERFVTAVFAELDVDTGRLRWTVAGHPLPLLLRGGRIVKALGGDIGLPLGLGGQATVAEEVLEAGDQLLVFTDGVTEARSPDGQFFGLDRLVDLVGRASASQDPPPETLRRLIHAILAHQQGDLQDDATAVLVEWRGSAVETLKL